MDEHYTTIKKRRTGSAVFAHTNLLIIINRDMTKKKCSLNVNYNLFPKRHQNLELLPELEINFFLVDFISLEVQAVEAII